MFESHDGALSHVLFGSHGDLDLSDEELCLSDGEDAGSEASSSHPAALNTFTRRCKIDPLRRVAPSTCVICWIYFRLVRLFSLFFLLICFVDPFCVRHLFTFYTCSLLNNFNTTTFIKSVSIGIRVFSHHVGPNTLFCHTPDFSRFFIFVFGTSKIFVFNFISWVWYITTK